MLEELSGYKEVEISRWGIRSRTVADRSLVQCNLDGSVVPFRWDMAFP